MEQYAIQVKEESGWRRIMVCYNRSHAEQTVAMLLGNDSSREIRFVAEPVVGLVDVEDDEDAEITPALIREAAARLLDDAERRAETWGESPGSALSVSFREMADAWPALAEAVAREVGLPR